MATIKSYTDISQSKKLAEILPIESADMEYLAIKENGVLVGAVPFVKDDSEVEDSAYSHIYDRIACWSLAALLNALPSLTLDGSDDHYFRVLCNKRTTEWCDNAVDTCYEIILKLHELNKKK
jgi:hypothetical protein